MLEIAKQTCIMVHGSCVMHKGFQEQNRTVLLVTADHIGGLALKGSAEVNGFQCKPLCAPPWGTATALLGGGDLP